jgi:tetratricopeptide (TPR) repeat protein
MKPLTQRLPHFLFLAALLLGAACTEILDVEVPGDQLKEDEAITSQQDVMEVLQSCYDVNANIYNGRIQYANELLGDNVSLQNNSGDLGQIFSHSVSIFNGTVSGIYGDPYITIFRANRLLELLEEFPFSAAERTEIEAQVYFLRAISHWEVLKLWAQPYGYTADNSHPGVVYKTSTDVKVLARATVAESYQNIIADLERAINSGGLPQKDPYRASVDAARAYLAEVYFQKGDYQQAATEAATVIGSNRYQLDTIIDRFQPDTAVVPEIIFKTRSFQPNNDLRSTAFTNNYRSDLAQPPFIRASGEFFENYRNDTLDRRVNAWLELRDAGTPDEYVAINRFNKPYFDVPVKHLTGLKLLRAQALLLNGGDVNTAIGDINDIRERAYGSDTMNIPLNTPQATVLEAVKKERRLEMLGEGDRIQQLKRRGALEGENILIRDHPWNCDGMILQFPATERTEEFEINPQGGC